MACPLHPTHNTDTSGKASLPANFTRTDFVEQCYRRFVGEIEGDSTAFTALDEVHCFGVCRNSTDCVAASYLEIPDSLFTQLTIQCLHYTYVSSETFDQQGLLILQNICNVTVPSPSPPPAGLPMTFPNISLLCF